MPEINKKNVIEQSRTEVHNEDSEHFDDREESAQKVHDDDTSQIKQLSDKLDSHCKQNIIDAKINDEHYKSNASKIDKLLPLVNLIPTLNEIVENQKAMSIVGKKVLKIIGVISAIIGLIYLIFRFWKEVK